MRERSRPSVQGFPRLARFARLVVMLLSITAAGMVLNGCSSDDGGCDYEYPINDQPLCVDLALEFDCQEAFQDQDACLLENCLCDVPMDCDYTFNVDTMEDCQNLADRLLCGTPAFAAGVCTLSTCQVCIEDTSAL